MVTAQHSNTQYVAHEFVRQYYTMLHKDPTQMHRFYTCESRFTHGVSTNAKSEEPVCGQQAIYEKISQLNFRNCYAKIRSVDSHPTIAGGVVIQVSGELSNGGNAMRKFMQTFVLAQQDVKRYNVFNDIFRYQDEMFEDTEVEESANGTLESENGYASQEAAQVNQLDTIPDTDSEEHEVTSEEESEEEQEAPAPAPAPVQEVPAETYQYNDQESVVPVVAEEEVEVEVKEEEVAYEENEVEPALNNEIEPSQPEIPEQFEETNYYEPVESREEAEPEAPAEELSEQEVVVEDDGTEFKEEDDGTEFKEYDGNDIKVEEPPEEEQEQVEPEPEPEPEEPQVFSWAGVTKKNTAAANTITPSPAPAKPPVKKLSPSQAPKKVPPQKREEPSIPKPEGNDEQRRRTPAPDNHQIFIGNLPIGVTEKDVREAFKEFGTILEVRLNPKNFGFIAFTGPEAPAKILGKPKNIVIHNNTINTEVKRSVSGVGRGGGGGGGRFQRGGGDRDNNRGGGRNDMNRNSNRNPGSGNNGGGGGGGPPGGRTGKNSTYNPKQPRQGGDEGRYERQPRDQKNPRNNQRGGEPRT